ncbi:unnamed protein product [Protopolystoma xenopodis]|uniref:Uncharacterized protein n=1 Tax=Protopolystoma xenopodis TaxID=117903 RepID=A0A448WI14_9PLAT|nr:unnamed protein product [Protopolystoma xenopodis]
MKRFPYSRAWIRFVRRPQAPSIPSLSSAYGYEEALDGWLQAQSGPDRDTSLGPAFYNPAEESKDPIGPGRRYRGCQWSKWVRLIF